MLSRRLTQGRIMRELRHRQIDLQHDVVTRYQRPVGVVEENYRAIPEMEVAELMRFCRHTPKILFEGRDVYTERYINGNSLDSLYIDFQPMERTDIDAIVRNIVFTAKVKDRVIQNSHPWQNCEDFFEFQVENMRAAIEKHPKKTPAWRQAFGLTEKAILEVEKLPAQIDNSRPLCFIHGDRGKTNMVRDKRGKVYFIDWEFACFGDLAYEIAFHLHQMNYCESDQQYFLEKLARALPRRYRSLFDDLEKYSKFIALRSVLYMMRALQECSYSDTSCDRLYLRLKKLSQYPEFWIYVSGPEEVRQKVHELKVS